MKLIIFISFVFIFPSYAQESQKAATLEVTINGARNNEGTVFATLFETANGFPGKAEKAFAKASKKLSKGNTIVFQNIPPGSYAVAILHDENDNDKMDTNFIGLPKEGYGASNDAKGTFGPPKFEDAKFDIKDKITRISINLIY